MNMMNHPGFDFELSCKIIKSRLGLSLYCYGYYVKESEMTSGDIVLNIEPIS